MLRLNWYLQITWTNTKETRYFTISKTETAQRSNKFRQYRKVKVEEPWKIRSYQPDPRVPFTHAPYLQFSPFFGRSPRKKMSKTDESFQGWAPSWRIFQKFWVFSICLFSKWRVVDDIRYIYICYGILGHVSRFWRPCKSFFFGSMKELWRMTNDVSLSDVLGCQTFRHPHALLGTNISHLGKGKIIFKSALIGYVSFLEGIWNEYYLMRNLQLGWSNTVSKPRGSLK